MSMALFQTSVIQLESYEYDSLEDEPGDTIRLLKLLPTNTIGEIHASLTTVRLIDKPEYLALSYTWGEETGCEQIVLDGCRLQVRRNLWTFLRRLKRDGEVGFLWADAICVNQQDLRERSSQVALMGRLYSEARVVYAWLGEDRSRKSLTPHEQQILVDDATKLRTIDFYAANQHFSLSASTERDFETRMQICELIQSLSTHSYWRRAWIVQEVSHAQNLALLYDSHGCLQWEDFQEWYKSIAWRKAYPKNTDRPDWTEIRFRSFSTLYSERLSKAMYSLMRTSKIHSMRDNLSESLQSQRYLESLAHRHCETSECSGPRDKIYAYLGLASDQPLQADYARPRAALFWDLYCLQRPQQGSLKTTVLIEALRLNEQDVRNLILCLAVTRPFTWDTVWDLDPVLQASPQSPTPYSYDEELIEWFQCSREKWTELLECVDRQEKWEKMFREGRAKKLYIQWSAQQLRDLMRFEFLSTVLGWNQGAYPETKENAKLIPNDADRRQSHSGASAGLENYQENKREGAAVWVPRHETKIQRAIATADEKTASRSKLESRP